MMDVDLDQDLMSKFSSMGTTDRDVLINEFQKLLGNNLNPATCAFFLDMNNWNLQAAIGSYYDIEANLPVQRLPHMTFVKDVTIGEGESVPPCTEFTKTWRVRNPATDQWPPGSCLRFIHGHQLGPLDRVYTEPLNGQTDMDISVKMHSPSHCGVYQGQWRMCTSTGVFYGETIWVIVEVKEGGMLGLTQQLSQLGTGSMETDSAPSTDRIMPNPFGSPTKPDGTLIRESTPEPPSFHSPSKPEHSSHLSSPVRPPLFQHDSSVQIPTQTLSERDPRMPAVFHDYQLPHHHAPENTAQPAFPTNQSTASFSTLQAPNPTINQSEYTFHDLRTEDTMTDEDL
ncbi:protein ILRUN-like [Lytechinus pictus]|uniref:protein ILRUN-like n=1 Tax=Lytechinus pictus TaxID=7653 RepID=UPI00240D9E07|nr:protein ILRUN-like [Lytechinus pictus]